MVSQGDDDGGHADGDDDDDGGEAQPIPLARSAAPGGGRRQGACCLLGFVWRLCCTTDHLVKRLGPRACWQGLTSWNARRASLIALGVGPPPSILSQRARALLLAQRTHTELDGLPWLVPLPSSLRLPMPLPQLLDVYQHCAASSCTLSLVPVPDLPPARCEEPQPTPRPSAPRRRRPRSACLV